MNLIKRMLIFMMAFTLAVTTIFAFEITDVNAASNPYPATQNVDGDGNYEVPCTRFAWQQVYDNSGIALPAWGNAVNWWNNAKNAGYATGSTPKAGAVAVWSGDTYGHVAYVTSGSGNTFTVNEGGRTDLDHTSSHGVAYGYTLTNAVGGRRPYDTNKILLGFIYPGDSGKVGDSTISVTKGTSATPTKFSWTKATNAKTYNLRIKKYNGKEYVTYKDVWNLTSTSYSMNIPVGDYYAYVDACNGSNFTRSWNAAYFSIKYWYNGKTINNLGDDFYARIVLTHTGKAPGVNSATKNIENVAYTSDTDANYISQFWHFVRNSDGSYRILNAYYKNLPLQAAGTTSGSNVVLGTSYTGSNAQHWYVYGAANGQYIIRNKASEFVLNVHNAYSAAGTNLQIWKYTDSGAERMTIEKHTTHKWNNGTITTNPTCTSTGVKTYTCLYCDATKTETLNKLPHEPGDWEVETKASLSDDGMKVTYCQNCGEETDFMEILMVDKVKLSKDAYVYDGKAKNPSVIVTSMNGEEISPDNYTVKKLTSRKYVGKHGYKITFKNEYEGEKTVYFKINPKATYLTKKPTAYRKAFKASWKKVSTQVTGYEIKYSTSKNFTKSTSNTTKVKSYKTTSKKVTGLKAKKTYYVKVRTYKTVNGVNYYSAWSKYKTVKTR